MACCSVNSVPVWFVFFPNQREARRKNAAASSEYSTLLDRPQSIQVPRILSMSNNKSAAQRAREKAMQERLDWDPVRKPRNSPFCIWVPLFVITSFRGETSYWNLGMCRAFEHPLLAPVFLSFVVDCQWA
jgi:hypothetical protein